MTVFIAPDHQNPDPNKSRQWMTSLAWGLRIIGSFLLLLGSRWYYIFTFTTYRAHLAHVGAPLGVVTCLLGTLLVLSPRWVLHQLKKIGPL